MPTGLESPPSSRTSFTGTFPGGVFISGFQEQVVRFGNDWKSKLKFWEFGVSLVQKLESERLSTPEADFNRAYEGMILLLLMLGMGLKEEITDPETVEHLKANLENLTSKYITLKLPPLESKENRLLNLLGA